MSQVQDQAIVDGVKDDHLTAPIPDADRLLLEWCAKLTRTPAEMSQADVDQLREAGFTDEAIHDACQVAAYFNYINRIADALGVDPEAPDA